MNTGIVVELYSKLTSSMIAATIFGLCYLVIYALIIRRQANTKSRQIWRIRTLYTIALIFGFVLTKIWVAGFTQVLALLSLISAGLVIANKELVLNLSGFFVINWRGLFSEHDFIKINDCAGYISEIGALYFTLFEASPLQSNRTTGKTIKIPNSMVMSHPVINHSKATNFIEYTIRMQVSNQLAIDTVKELFERTVNAYLADYYQNEFYYKPENLAKKNKQLSGLMNFKCAICLQDITDQEQNWLIGYYCYPKDEPEICPELQKLLAKKLKSLLALKNQSPKQDIERIEDFSRELMQTGPEKIKHEEVS